MSLRRFRDLDEAREDLWTSADDPELLQRISSLWRRSSELAGVEPRPGVWRFRSIEEANADRDDHVRRRMVALRRRRGGNG